MTLHTILLGMLENLLLRNIREGTNGGRRSGNPDKWSYIYVAYTKQLLSPALTNHGNAIPLDKTILNLLRLFSFFFFFNTVHLKPSFLISFPYLSLE